MSNKVFVGIITLLIVGFVGFFAFGNKQPDKPRLGVDQADEGRQHVAAGQKQTYKAAIPTSGPHANPAQWGVSEQELPDESVIHNMEHGGVIISYRPDLDPATVEKLKGLFAKPFAVSTFMPNKAIVMPRANQQKPIVLASWNRIFEIDSFNQQTLIDYYLGNVSKSPEPTAS